MSEELIPKTVKVPPQRSRGAEVAALNDLLMTLNNPAITGAQVPPGEDVRVPVPAAAGLIPPVKAPEPEPTQQQQQQRRALEEAIAKVKAPTGRPLIVLTGRSGVGKSWLQARLRGTRNVVTTISDAADFRALRDAGAEFWHVMASEDALTRRRSPAAAKRAVNQLVLTLDMDANKKLAVLPSGDRLHVIWNDDAPPPYPGMYNTTAFLNAVS
jgi:hypothetical protein